MPLKIQRLISALILTAFLSSPGFVEAAKTQPNIIFIAVDGLRQDAIGAYGNELADTPVMDKLCKNGVLFKNFFHPTPLARPNLATLLTGLYPPDHGMRDDYHFKLAEEAATLPELLKGKGYATYAFLGSARYPKGLGFGRGLDVFDDEMAEKEGIQRDLSRPFLPADKLNEKVFEKLTRDKTLLKSAPFFLWIQYSDLEFLKDPYDSAVSKVDKSLGELTGFLNKNKLHQNTLIVITSSRPKNFGEHRTQTPSAYLYDTGLKAPLILSSAQLLKGAKTVDSLVSSADVLPSVLDLLFQEKGKGGGLSFVPLFHDEKAPEDRAIYMEAFVPVDLHGLPLKRGVRTLRYKYILHGENAGFFDVLSDPLELSPVARNKGKRVREMRKKLLAIENNFSRSATRNACLVKGNFLDPLVRADIPKDWTKNLGLQGGLKAKKIKYGELLKALEEGLAKDPYGKSNRLSLVRLYSLNPAIREKYIEQLELLIKNDPLFMPAYQMLARLYRKKEDGSKFEDLWLRAKAADPESDIPYQVLSVFYLNEGRAEPLSKLLGEYEARSRFKASGLWTVLAARGIARDHWQEAAGYCDKALSLNKMNLPARDIRASVRLREGDMDKAMEDLLVIKSVDAEIFEKIMHRQILYYRIFKKDPDVAEKILSRFEKESKGSYYVEFNKALNLKSKGEISGAIKKLHSVADLTKDEKRKADAYEAIAEVYVNLSYWKEAKKYYEMVLEADPHRPLVVNNYAWIRGVKDREVSEAIQSMRRIFSLAPPNPQFLDTLAELYYVSGKPIYALRVQREAFKKVPHIPVVRGHFIKYRDEVRRLPKKAVKSSAWKRPVLDPLSAQLVETGP